MEKVRNFEEFQDEQLKRHWEGEEYLECQTKEEREYTESLYEICGTMVSMYQQNKKKKNGRNK